MQQETDVSNEENALTQTIRPNNTPPVSLTDNVQAQIPLNNQDNTTLTPSSSWISKLNPLNWLSRSAQPSQKIIVEKIDLNAPKEQNEQNPDAGTSHDEIAQGQNTTPPTKSTENSYEEDPNTINIDKFFEGLNNQEETYAELPIEITGNTYN